MRKPWWVLNDDQLDISIEASKMVADINDDDDDKRRKLAVQDIDDEQ